MKTDQIFLLTGFLDDTLSDDEAVRLREMLRGSPAARQMLRELASIDTKLVELAAAPPPAAEILHRCPPTSARIHVTQSRCLRPCLFALLAVAGGFLVLLGIKIGDHTGRTSEASNLKLPPGVVSETTDDGVAVLVNAIAVVWPNQRTFQLGSILSPGAFELQSGLVEIEFYSGARLIVEGPASLEIVSAQQAICHSGKLRALVPSHARGFSITTTQFDLVDLGTEFGMEVKAGGVSKVEVFDGEVELYPPGVPHAPQQARRLLGGSGLSWTIAGEPTPVVSEPSGFSSFEQVRLKSQAQSRQRYAAWQAWNQCLTKDPRIAVRYDFETRGDTLFDSGAAAAHGTVIGCAWTSGRWGDKGALEFKRPSDRVRVDIPGIYDKMTLTAWIRVDALPARRQGLLLTDGFKAGHLHWQISFSGDLHLSLGKPESSNNPDITNHGSPVLFAPQQIGVWSLVASTYDLSQGKVQHFLNDRQVSQGDIQHDQQMMIGLADIGNWGIPLYNNPQPIRNFVGRMDEITLWNTALDSEEIREIYLNTHP